MSRQPPWWRAAALAAQLVAATNARGALQEAIPEDLGNIGMFRLESTMKEEQAKPLIGENSETLQGCALTGWMEQEAWIEALEQGTTDRAHICADRMRGFSTMPSYLRLLQTLVTMA